MIHLSGVTDDIRRAIKIELLRRGIQHQEAAERIGVSATHLSRMLSEAGKARSGDLPESWKNILNLLDLELTAVPKSEL
jgi:predicted transcriptional regulator